MDPNQTLAVLIDAATDGDVDRMNTAYEHLWVWMNRGGFAPRLRDVLAILTVEE